MKESDGKLNQVKLIRQAKRKKKKTMVTTLTQ